MATKQITDVRDKILGHLREIQRPLSWIADENTGIPYSAVYAIFKQRTYALSEKNLIKINKHLGTEFIIE